MWFLDDSEIKEILEKGSIISRKAGWDPENLTTDILKATESKLDSISKYFHASTWKNLKASGEYLPEHDKIMSRQCKDLGKDLARS